MNSHLGDVQFNAKTAEYFRADIQFPFFEHYLKGKGAPQVKAVVFETGTNVWRRFDAWAPKAVSSRTLYFHAGGKLSFDPPDESNSEDEYVSDPGHPVPFVGYPTDTVPRRYMVDDQRFASYRPDVVVYETEPLTPGKETDIEFTMPDLFHTFRRGHRIMVQVESSWFPLTDRNPQTFTDIPYARPEDFQKATEQTFHQKGAASGVEVLVLPQQ